MVVESEKKDKKNILLFCPDPGMEGFLSRFIGGLNFDITSLNKVEQINHFEDVDLVLVCHQFEKQNGIIMARAISEKDPDLPVILLATSKEMSDVMASFSQGVFDYIVPPYDRGYFRESVMRALARRDKWRNGKELVRTLETKINVLEEKISNLENGMLKGITKIMQRSLPLLNRHSLIVAKIGESFVKFLEWNPRDIEKFKFAALSHDVGYLLLPQEIGTRDPQTPPEIFNWKRHPLKSAELLELVMTESKVVEAVESHHEMYDGSGFPRGLKAHAIPFMGRVLALINDFAIKISPPRGGEGIPVEDAVMDIMNSSGKLYDPELVEEFIKMVSDIGLPEINS